MTGSRGKMAGAPVLGTKTPPRMQMPYFGCSLFIYDSSWLPFEKGSSLRQKSLMASDPRRKKRGRRGDS
ncbi:hypothetical protein TRIATDRAFT_259188 [Trichoderma atroviride IMI 206040]|uniref:Uncharacterized protein n=1 Tax=Hypocrea atroviridis (strain ATCC 20476 / IMI 206040) TaxID=452589 RepID=G9P4S8_HYPAI|nr:uncharacterized protein TRIATDRAFT_259188 [Trichoderma atroviride IMI 206040]EHK41222.1 hypothetical protein TRIATDRAFT_259188 [Trichoderma atroviride IMI 206040]